jgi:hypothetical protein
MLIKVLTTKVIQANQAMSKNRANLVINISNTQHQTSKKIKPNKASSAI